MPLMLVRLLSVCGLQRSMLSSGVEAAKGIKDAEKIRAFCAAVHRQIRAAGIEPDRLIRSCRINRILNRMTNAQDLWWTYPYLLAPFFRQPCLLRPTTARCSSIRSLLPLKIKEISWLLPVTIYLTTWVIFGPYGGIFVAETLIPRSKS